MSMCMRRRILKFLWDSSPVRRNGKLCLLARLDEFDAKKDIPRDQATGPLLTFTWVRTVKNGHQTIGCVCALLGRRSERSKESLRCPTPGPQIYKMLLVLAAYHGWSVRFFDVSRAFLHTPIKTRVFAVPPEEYQSRIPGGVWEMTKTVFGLEEAPADFDEHVGKESEDLCDVFGSLCLTRLMSQPAAFQPKLTGGHDVETHGRQCVGWSR